MSNEQEFDYYYIVFRLFGQLRYNGCMEHIKAHIVATSKKKERRTERGELMQFFMSKLNPPRVRDGYPALNLPRMGKILQTIPTKDLYYLKSVCEGATDFSKKFWWEVNPKKHENNPDVLKESGSRPKRREKPLHE